MKRQWQQAPPKRPIFSPTPSSLRLKFGRR
jgi:hypothetical protein